jgi:hypothetical protein
MPKSKFMQSLSRLCITTDGWMLLVRRKLPLIRWNHLPSLEIHITGTAKDEFRLGQPLFNIWTIWAVEEPQLNLRPTWGCCAVASNSLKFQPWLPFFSDLVLCCLYILQPPTQLVFTIFLPTKLFARNRRMPNEKFHDSRKPLKEGNRDFANFFALLKK